MADPEAVGPARPSLVSGRRIGRNSVLNLATGGSLLLLHILFVPFMLRAFGMELYGVLAVTWMVLGHLRWLDLGFSAACAKHVAEDLAWGRTEQAGLWAWTAVTAQSILGGVAAVALWILAPTLADLLRIQPESRDLVILALRLFALVIPLDLAARSLMGVLEGAQRFGWINALNAFAALWTYSAYTVGILRGGDFHAVVYGLVALKGVQLLATFAVAARVVPNLRSFTALGLSLALDRLRLLQMIRFGGWVSVSAATAPAIVFFDRWVIGGVEGVAMLPFYSVPFNFLLTLLLIPGSLASTLFPAFSAMEARTRWDRLEAFFVHAHRYLLIGILPLFFVLFVWAPEILRVWIGEEFAAQAGTAFRILVLGFSVGFFAPLSGALLQGAGRPDILAKIYLVELPLNFVVTWVLVRQYGILGAAASLALRSIVETAILLFAVYRNFPLSAALSVREVLRPAILFLLLGMAVVGFLLPEAHINSAVSLGSTLLVLLLYGWAVYSLVLDANDRSFFRSLAQRAPA